MIFILIVSCFMVIFWGGCALDETVTPLLFSLTDGRFPPPNAFGEPSRLFTACITYSEGVFIGLQISVFLLEVIALLYVLCKKGFSLSCKLTACFGAVFTLAFIVFPMGSTYIIPIKAFISILYVVFAGLHVHRYRKSDRV